MPLGHRRGAGQYGPCCDTYIDTGDPRGRDIHGGGFCSDSPLVGRQGWCVTLGCTRAQNEDLQELVSRLRAFKKRHPGVPVPYQRVRRPASGANP